jgi:purine nucleosidase
MVPLDLSHQMLTTNERIAAFRNIGNRAGRTTAEMLEFFERFDEQKYGWQGGPLHDPCVIAWLLQPELFEGRLINVEVELQGALTVGMTVADFWGVTSRPRNVTFLRSGDADGFYRLLVERISRLP